MKKTAPPINKNIQLQDIRNIRNQIQTLKRELDRMREELEKTNMSKLKIEAEYKSARNKREELEVLIKKKCMLQELEKVQTEKRLKNKTGQNLKEAFQTLNLKQIVFSQYKLDKRAT